MRILHSLHAETMRPQVLASPPAAHNGSGFFVFHYFVANGGRGIKDRIITLLRQGKSYNDIVADVGCSKATISYHARRQGRAQRRSTYHWKEIQDFHNQGHSLEECIDRFGFSRMAWHKAKERNVLVVQSRLTPLNEMTVRGSTAERRNLKKRLVDEGLLINCCARCRITMWQGQMLALQLHHKNGVSNDNRLDNLELLCPNCHSLTDTYCGRNVKLRRVRACQEHEPRARK